MENGRCHIDGDIVMKKHAYLIMAHNEFDMLRRLLKELDDPRNDIYLHIDKKAKGFDFNILRNSVKHSQLILIPGMNIYWGTISQVKCELRLMQAAAKGQYHYYHLLSGSDFPLKSQDYIHEYLANDTGEYVNCFKNDEARDDFMFKIMYYYPLLKYVGKGNTEGHNLKARCERKLGYWQLRLLEIQKQLNIDRTRKYKNFEFYKGDNWFSITDDLVKFIIGHRKQILKLFFITNGPDEFFVQTLAMNSHFADRVKCNSLREIDWERGKPYEYTMEDLDMLKRSDAFFARKISFERSPELVEALTKYLHDQ